MSLRHAGFLVALASALVAIGCQGPNLRFRPVRTVGTAPSGERIETRDFIPTDLPDHVRVEASARADVHTTDDGLRVPIYHLRIRVDNQSPERPFELERAGTHIRDDENRRFDLTRLRVDGERTGSATLLPGHEGRIEMEFETSPGYDLERVASFRLFWGFRLGGRSIRHETKFNLVMPHHYRHPVYHHRYDPWRRGPWYRDPWDPWGPHPPRGYHRGPGVRIGIGFSTHHH